MIYYLICIFYDYNITEPPKEPTAYFWPKISDLIYLQSESNYHVWIAKTRPTSMQPFSQEKFNQIMYVLSRWKKFIYKIPPYKQIILKPSISLIITITLIKFQESNRLWPIQWLYPCSYCGKIQTYLCSCGWCGSVYCCNQWTTCCWSNSRPNIPGIFLKDTIKYRKKSDSRLWAKLWKIEFEKNRKE